MPPRVDVDASEAMWAASADRVVLRSESRSTSVSQRRESQRSQRSKLPYIVADRSVDPIAQIANNSKRVNHDFFDGPR